MLSTVLFALVVTVAPPPDASFEQLIEAAVAAKTAGEQAKTLEYLRRAHQMRPSPQLLNNIGRTLEVLGRYREARAAYTKVANDPKAPTELRALDAARAGALQSRVGRAWVVLKPSPRTAKAWVGNQPVTVPSGAEFPAVAGRQVIEYQLAARETVVLRRHELASDVRTTVEDDLLSTADAAITLPKGLKALSVDGRALMSDLEGAKTLALPPGKVVLVATWADGGDQKRSVAVVAGASRLTVLLGPRPKAVPEPPVIVKPAHKPAILGPVLTGVGGLALLGVGTWLVVDAGNLRDEVKDAERDKLGAITGLTYAEAVEKESDADTRSTIGATLLAVGGAAAVGAVIWVLVDQLTAPKGSSPRSAEGLSPLLGPDRAGLSFTTRF